MFLKSFILIIVLFQTLLFSSYTAYIVDKSSYTPIKNSTISDSYISVNSDKNGEFTIDTNESVLHVKACGYRPYKINLNNNERARTIKCKSTLS